MLSGSSAAGGPTPLSVSTLSSSSRPPTSSLATVTDVRTQNMLSQVNMQSHIIGIYMVLKL